MRKYLPTAAELLDRLSIVLMKAIFIAENRDEYLKEIELIEHDINMELNAYQGSGKGFTAYDFRMVLMLMLANRFIWQNEGEIRTTPMTEGKLDGYKDIAQKLIATHSVNGVRNRAKNNLAAIFSGRLDFKVDCLAGDLPPQYGGWIDVLR